MYIGPLCLLLYARTRVPCALAHATIDVGQRPLLLPLPQKEEEEAAAAAAPAGEVDDAGDAGDYDEEAKAHRCAKQTTDIDLQTAPYIDSYFFAS